MKIKKTKIIVSVSLFLLMFFAAGVLKTKAGALQNVIGWMGGWAQDAAGNYGGIGWVSMNDYNCDVDGNLKKDALCGGDNATTPVGENYGVNIPATDGPVYGSAWSEGVGYIDFAPAGPYPAAPNYSAGRVGNALVGWARISGIASESVATPESPAGNSGGWKGWIKMSGVATDGSAYGITIGAGNLLSGYAYSDELGWIHVRDAQIRTNPKLIITGSMGTSVKDLAKGISCIDGSPNGGACQVDVSTPTTFNLPVTPGSSYSDAKFDLCPGGAVGLPNCSVTVGASDVTVHATATLNCVADPTCGGNASNVCTYDNCTDLCGLSHPGQKTCPAIGAGNWKEVGL